MDEELDIQLVDRTLKNMAKGTGIIFIGMIIGVVLELINKIIIINSVSRTEYGLFSFGLVIFSMAAIISLGGFQQSIPRYLGYYRGKKDKKSLRSTVGAAFQAGIGLGIAVSIIIFFGAGFIESFFGLEGLKFVLQLFAIGIPLYNFIGIVSAIFRGFDKPKPRIYFTDIGQRFSRFLLLLMVVFLGASLYNITLVYVLALAVASIGASIYYLKFKPEDIQYEKNVREKQIVPRRKELLFFSLPLFGVIFLNQIMNWTDVLVLGYFTSADLVGLYSGGMTLARFITYLLAAGGFMFVPIFSTLYSQKKFIEMRRSYAVLSKWIFSATLPLFIIMFIFPHVILTFLFGTPYRGASTALRILSIGFIFHVVVGLNGATLIVMGKTKFLASVALICLGLNVVLNFILIPIFGIEGAATATTTTYITINIINSLMVYKISKIHPFTLNYIKPLLISAILISGLILFFKYILPATVWMLPFIFLIFIALYFLGIFVSKSFDREDIMFLGILEKRSGLNLEMIKRLFKKL